jgi:hypothetical protein
MDLGTGAAKLQFALRNLRVRWEETKSEWADAVRVEFEKEHWDPIEMQVTATLAELARLDQLIVRAQQECE